MATDAKPTARLPGPGAVLWGSLALFAILFALLTYQLSAGASASGTAAGGSPVAVRKVIQRRIVTTVVPTPGKNRVVSGPATSSASEEPASEPVTTSAS